MRTDCRRSRCMLKHSSNTSDEALWVAWRYLIHGQASLSSVGRLSLLGLVISVVVLIVVLSVVNGFERELIYRVVALLPNVKVEFRYGVDEEDLRATESLHGVTAVAPVVEGNVLLMSSGIMRTALAVGIEGERFTRVTDILKHLQAESLARLERQKFSVVLGAGLARALGVSVGDFVQIVTPHSGVSAAGYVPRQKSMRVTALLHSGSLLDEQMVLMSQTTAKSFFREQRSRQMYVRLADIFATTQARRALYEKFAARVRVSSWSQSYGNLYQAIAVQRMTLFVLLLFLVAVAAFNLVSGLVMVVEQRRQDVAILRTMGITSGSILKIFVLLGAMLSCAGIVIGLVSGVALSLLLPQMFVWADGLTDHALMSQYFIERLPVEIRLGDVISVGSLAFLLSLLATIFPAWRATRLAPSRELAHE